jgi:hypothetical protein
MTFPPFRAHAACVAVAATLALGLLAQPALGQTPAPEAGAELALPKFDCGKKPEHPGKMASENMQRQWRKSASAYLECYKTYASATRALAQRYTEAVNKVIDDYNTAAKEIQAAADAALE